MSFQSLKNPYFLVYGSNVSKKVDTYSACKVKNTFFIFLNDMLQNFLEKSWRNLTSITPGNLMLHHEIIRFCLYSTFFFSLSPGNFSRQFSFSPWNSKFYTQIISPWNRNTCFLTLQALYQINLGYLRSFHWHY